ncbi:MAG: hypothetical protein RAK22_00020 [Nanoarchaeota archaeon]|nr:hypothetical protein [Nanoarchaeota archaeon]
MINDILPENLSQYIFDIAEDKDKVYLILKENNDAAMKMINQMNDEIRRMFNQKNLEILDLFQMIQNNMLSQFEDSVSLLDDEPFLSHFGIEEYVEVTYDLSPLNQSRKMLFNYALLGRRGNPGLLQQVGGRKIGRGIIQVPKNNAERIESFIKGWGISYAKRLVLDFREV